MGLFSSIGKVFKSVAKVAAPIVGAVTGGIKGSSGGVPGVITGAIGGINEGLQSPLGQAGQAIIGYDQTREGIELENEQNIANAREVMQFNSAEAAKTRNWQSIWNTRAQKYNHSEAVYGRRFSAAQAALQRKWSEGLSNSAHQRQVLDLERAGLNPILSAKYGGASSPPGAAASAGANASISTPGGATASGRAATVRSAAGPAIATAMQIWRANAEVDQVRQNTRNARQVGENLKEEQRLIRNRAEETAANTALSRDRANLTEADKRRVEELIHKIRADTSLTKTQKKQAEQVLKSVTLTGEIDESLLGVWLRVLQKIAPGVSSAASLGHLVKGRKVTHIRAGATAKKSTPKKSVGAK